MAKKETEGELMNPMAEKLKALQAAMSKIEKDFGKGSIMKLGDENVENVEVIPTGSIALNAALGVGGYPKGRIIEIYGPESSGKTIACKIHCSFHHELCPCHRYSKASNSLTDRHHKRHRFQQQYY